MDKIYQALLANLGKHLTLNPSVSPELGCAEAVSAILREIGVEGIPALGFSGTAALNSWVAGSPHFEKIQLPEIGALIISPTVGMQHGHTGFFGKFNLMYVNDWGICSNDSSNGLFREQWSYREWLDYYKTALGLEMDIYRYTG